MRSFIFTPSACSAFASLRARLCASRYVYRCMPPSTVFDTISVLPWCRSAWRIRSEIISGMSIIKPSMAVPPRNAFVSSKACQDFLRVVHHARAADDMRYCALLIDDEGDPVRETHHRLREAEQSPAADRAIGARHRAVGIRQQGKVEAMGLREALVGGRILRRYAEDLRALGADVRVMVAQRAGLRRASGGEIHRIEIQHELRAPKIGKADL